MTRIQNGTQSRTTPFPTQAEVQVLISRGTRLQAEAIANLVGAALRALGRLLSGDGDMVTTISNPVLPENFPARGLVGLFIPRESWVRNDGWPMLRVVSTEVRETSVDQDKTEAA